MVAMDRRPMALVRPVRETVSTAMLADRPRSSPRPLISGVSIFQVPLIKKMDRKSSQKGAVLMAWPSVRLRAAVAAAGRFSPLR